MKRTLVIVTAMFLLALPVPRSALAFGVKDVVAMSQDGIPDSLVIEKIRHSDTRFDLNAKDMHTLRVAGVSDDVVVAMLRTEDRGRARVYYDGVYWPYVPNAYLGLHVGFYRPFRRAYAPIYVGHGPRYRGFAGGWRR